MYFKRWRDFFNFNDADATTFLFGGILPIGIWGAFLGVPLGMGPDVLMLFWMLIPLVGFHELVHMTAVNSKESLKAYADIAGPVALVDQTAVWWPLSRLSLARRMKQDSDAFMDEGAKRAMTSLDDGAYQRLLMLGHIKQHRAESQRARRVALSTIFVVFPALLAVLWPIAPMAVTAVVTTFALPAPTPMLIAIPIAFSLAHLFGRLSYGFGLFLTEDSRRSTNVDEWMDALVDQLCQEQKIPSTSEFRPKVLATIKNKIISDGHYDQLTAAIRSREADSKDAVESALTAIDQAIKQYVGDVVASSQSTDILAVPQPAKSGESTGDGKEATPGLGVQAEAGVLPTHAVSAV